MPSAEEIAKTFKKLAAIRQAALDNDGCKNIKLFTQSVAGEAYATLDKHGEASGICCALSILWLASRKTASDYIDKILGPGGSVKEEDIKPAIQLQKELSSPDTQVAQAMNWLGRQGFSGSRKPKKQTNSIPHGIGDWFTQSWAEGGPYRLLGIRGYCNHATALDLSPGKLAFFDPNLGRFDFKTEASLATFLNTEIFQKRGGDCHYIGNEASSTLLEMVGLKC